MQRLAVGLGMAVVLLTSAGVSAAPHPHYDDGGAVNWKSNWAAARQAAAATGKPIFVEAGIEN